MENRGRPNHIEDYLITLHTGQWFGFKNLNGNDENKIYANLIIHDNTKTKPTEQECIDGLAQLQFNYDALEWKRNRRAEYPDAIECVHALLDGGDTLTDLQAQRTVIKEKYPKE